MLLSLPRQARHRDREWWAHVAKLYLHYMFGRWGSLMWASFRPPSDAGDD